jgi:hypothetical protein
MAEVRKMSNVAVAMQSALGAAKTITAITKASPGVVTSTAHGFSNGTYIELDVQGMYQLNAKVYRVVSVATDTFQLENISGGTGLSTVEFDTFVSGSARAITFGNSITTAADIAVSGGDFEFIDTTVIHTNQKSQIPGSASPISISMNQLWDITDAGQIAMKLASDLQQKRAFRFTFGTGGPIMLFTGYVGYVAAPTGSAQDKIVSPSVITAFGSPTYYSA